MPSILIRNGRVIDPSQTMDRVTNLLIRDGRIAGYDVAPNGQDAIIDAAGKIVSPGLIDMHVHLCCDSGAGASQSQMGATHARTGGQKPSSHFYKD